ncbi:cache domain-containing sensor histidine kinase [Paraliobacillus ryukyuensis]|uniref:cache domain-containing sensor histidine kinase n=1 Tax=Paraliobacillus ryukyuensis TaxID=200904 RepID=UPI0009A5D0A9|nr:sensor histidine kinase [Paraliobacillus ryukyuensis]
MGAFYQKISLTLLNLKIKNKLLIIYLLATVIPVLLAGLYLNYAIRTVVIENALDEAESNIDKIETRLHTMLSRVTSISDSIYLDRDMYTLLKSEYKSSLEVYHAYNRYPVFDNYLTYYDEIDNIQFYMTKDMITDSHFIHANEEIAESSWYLQAQDNRGKIAWIYKEEEWTNDRTLTLTRAVYDNQNNFLGVLCIYVSSDKLKEISSGELHDVIITIDNKTVIYHQNDAFIGQPASKLTRENGMPKVVQSNYVLDKTYQGQEVKVTVHQFKPTKALYNHIQIASIVPVETLMKKPNQIFIRGFAVTLGALIVSIVAYRFFIRSFNNRIVTLKQAMFKVAKGRFNIGKQMVGKDEIGEVYDELYQTTQSIQQLIEEVYVHKIKEERWRRKQKESDFKMLASQINPHFLYNTLEMIRMKAIMNKDREVAAIIQKLSKMMRTALKSTNDQIPLKEEVELIRTYLEIQSLRFGDHLRYQINTDVELDRLFIFPLLIQPIVENAIIHGIEPKEGTAEIKVSITTSDQLLQIEVSDNGVGMSKERLRTVINWLSQEDEKNEGKRIGVKNVHQRIQLYYGASYGMQIYSGVSQGTIVIIKLPTEQLTQKL